MKGWSSRACGRISQFSFSSQWGQQPPQLWRRGPKSLLHHSLPGIHFTVFMTPRKAKQLREETGPGCSQMRKKKREREMEEKHGKLLDKSCQQQLSHPSPSSESFHCIQTTNPTLCLEKQRGDLTEIHTGIFFFFFGVGCVGMPRTFRKDQVVQIRV